MNQNNKEYLRTRLNLALGAAFSTIFLAALVYQLQAGSEFSYSISPFLKFIAISIIINCGSFLVIARINKAGTLVKSFTELMLFIVISLAGFLLLRLGVSTPFYLLYVLSIGILIWVIVGYFALINFNFFFLSVAVVFASLLVYDNVFQSPLYVFKILNGTVHPDQLYHSSLSSIIGNYGVPSLGLDGHQSMKYHWLSHLFFAGINKLTISNSMGFYNLGYPIMIIPMFYFALYRLVNSISYLMQKRFMQPLFLAVFTLFLSYFVDIYPFSKGELLFAESFVLSIIFVFYLSIYVLEKVTKEHSLKSLDSASIATIIVTLVLLSLIKVSTAIVITTAFCLGYFLDKKNPKAFWISAITCLAVALCSYFFVIDFYRLESSDTSVVTRVGRIIRVSHGLFTMASSMFISYILYHKRNQSGGLKSIISWFWKGNFLESFLLYVSLFSFFLAIYASYNSADTAYFGVVQLFISIPVLFYLAYRYFNNLVITEKMKRVVLTVFLVAGILSQFELYASLKSDLSETKKNLTLKEDDFLRKLYLECSMISRTEDKTSTAVYFTPEVKSQLRKTYDNNIKRVLFYGAITGLVQIESMDFQIKKGDAYGLSDYLSSRYNQEFDEGTIVEKARKLKNISHLIVLDYQNEMIETRIIDL